MRILSLDLGTYTGVAFWDGVETRAHTVELATEKNLRLARKLRLDRRLDPRAVSLSTLLCDYLGDARYVPDFIVFEDVRFAKSLAQAQLWSSFRGVVWTMASLNRGVKVECLETGKLKKYATGSGSADKSFMASALVERHPSRFKLETGLVRDLKVGTLLDDNAVDALHLLDWARETLNK